MSDSDPTTRLNSALAGRRVSLLASCLLLPLGCGGDNAPTDPGPGQDPGDLPHHDLVVTTASLPNATVTVAYSEALEATGGDGDYTWSVIIGSLPAGLSLDAPTGQITGTPVGVGTSLFTVQVTSGDGETASQPLSIIVNTPPVLHEERGDLATPILVHSGRAGEDRVRLPLVLL